MSAKGWRFKIERKIPIIPGPGKIYRTGMIDPDVGHP
jgi:hypothetical protein